MRIITQDELDILFPNKVAQVIAVKVLGLYLAPKRTTIDIVDDQLVIIKRHGKIVYED